MKNVYYTVFATCCLFLSTVVAQDLSLPDLSGGSCEAGACSTSEKCTCSAMPACQCESSEACDCAKHCSSCEINSAMAQLPQMTFKVGAESTTCSATATKLAESQGMPVEYMVANETFPSKSAAMTTLISKTEALLKDFTTPSVCSVSGMTTIAGEPCECPITASAMTERMQSATKLVSVSFEVGDHVCSCPKEAAAMASKSGNAKTFVVGDLKTTCSQTARLAYARARYKAALIASSQTTATAGSDS